MNKNLKTVLSILIAISFLLPLNLQGASKESKKEREAARQLEEIMKECNTLGLAVAVVKNGKTIYANSFGTREIGVDAPFKSTDLFRIASISKSFVATAIMQLVDAKKIDLDSDISDYFGFEIRNPRYPESPITVRMLLSHTSSINDSHGYFNLDVLNPANNSNYETLFNSYAPTKGYEYCNLNFNALGAIIEKISGERFDNYIQKHIFKPLQIAGGHNVDSLDATLFVPLYEYDKEKKEFIHSPDAYISRADQMVNYKMGHSAILFSPTGGVKISAEDLARYMTMHMNYGKLGKVRIISEESAKLMQNPIIKTEVEDGYGFAIRTAYKLIPNKEMKGHTGSAYGLYSSMFFDPDKKFGIVMMTNGSDVKRADGFVDLQIKSIRALYDIFIK